MKNTYLFLIVIAAICDMSSLIGSQKVPAMTEPPKKRVVFLRGQKALFDSQQAQKSAFKPFKPMSPKSPTSVYSLKASTAPLSPSLIPVGQRANIQACPTIFVLEASAQLLRDSISGSGACTDSGSGGTVNSSANEFGSPRCVQENK